MTWWWLTVSTIVLINETSVVLASDKLCVCCVTTSVAVFVLCELTLVFSCSSTPRNTLCHQPHQMLACYTNKPFNKHSYSIVGTCLQCFNIARYLKHLSLNHLLPSECPSWVQLILECWSIAKGTCFYFREHSIRLTN